MYFISSCIIYLGLAFSEFYCLRNFLDMISENELFQLIVLILCLLVVNPLIVAYVIKKIPYKVKGLRLKKNKREIQKNI